MKDDSTHLDLVKKANNIAVFLSPIDGDSVGSGLSLLFILRKMGKNVQVFSSFFDLSFLSFLPDVKEIVMKDLFEVDLTKFDLGIFIDGSPLNRFYDRKIHKTDPLLPDQFKTLVIDHHPDEPFSPNVVKNLQVTSTCELVYNMFKDEVEIDKQIATYLYLGVSTDTGRFQYPNTTATGMRVAADLLEKGVDVGNLTLALEKTEDLKTIKYRAELISQISVDREFHYAFLSVSYSQWQKSGLTLEELDTVISNVRDDEMRSISEVGFVLNLTEREPGFIRGSLRGRIPGKFNMTVIARAFGGGGHPESSGFNIQQKTIEEAVKLVRDFIKGHYEEIKIK